MTQIPNRPGPADEPERGAGRPAQPVGTDRAPSAPAAARPGQDRAAAAGTGRPGDTGTAGRTGDTDRAGKADRSAKAGRAGKGPTEPRPGSDWGTFRAVVIAVGVVLAAVGVYFLIAGTHGLPDAPSGPFDPTLESQFRFFAAVEIGVGAAFIAIAVKFRWVEVLWLVCMMVFFGGVGRVISWAIVGGTPHWLMIVLMIIELAFPAALLVWHRWITKTVELKRSLASGR